MGTKVVYTFGMELFMACFFSLAEPVEITEFLLFFSVYSVRDLMARVRITPKKCKLSNEGCLILDEFVADEQKIVTTIIIAD